MVAGAVKEGFLGERPWEQEGRPALHCGAAGSRPKFSRNREPQKVAFVARLRGCAHPESQGRPLSIPHRVFPALWFPNLFGLKFVSNFFFPGVIETNPPNACSFLGEIKGDFKQEDHRFQKRGRGGGGGLHLGLDGGAGAPFG